MRNEVFYDKEKELEKEYAYYEELIEKNGEVNFDDDWGEDVIPSTVPIPTYNGKSRLNYIEVMQDYNSGNDRKQEKAAEKVIGDLTGLVMYIIKKKYSNYSAKYYDDLVQSGEMGILQGLKDYDPNVSLPATYFYYFIVHEIQSFINGNVYKTTPYYSANIKKINRAIAKFESMDMVYTNRDISIQTGIPLDTVEKVRNIMAGGSEVSLTAFGEQIEAPCSYNPEEEFFKKENIEFLYKVMREFLTQDEVKIIAYLYGIGGIETLSLKNIAKKLNFPIDKVKKLKTTAFCKLRNSPLAGMYPSSFRNDELELDDADSISLFPNKQAIAAMEDMKEMEIDF